MPSDRYYFANAKPEDVGRALSGRLADIRKRDNTVTARRDQFALAYGHYYGWDLGQGSTSEVARGGDQGELAVVRINHARRGAKALLSLLLGPRFSWRPQAPNSDPSSRAATIIATNLLEFQMKRRRLALLISRWVEAAIIGSEAFIFPEWDMGAGPELGFDPSTGRVLRQGDITYRVLMPWDVTREGDAKVFEDSPYLFGRIWRNKWDVAALNAFDIEGEPTFERIVEASNNAQVRDLSGAVEFPAHGDMIPLNYFFHRPTPTLPEGREVLFINEDLVLRDRPLTRVYPNGMPLCRFAVDDQMDTPFGYSSWWDTLSAQQVLDGCESAVASNLLAYGNQSIAVEQGTQTPADHAYGGKVFYYPKNGKPPEPLMMAALPPAALDYIQQKSSNVLELLGLNDVYMGSPDTAQMNAQAFALLASMAVQANSPTQNLLLDALSNLGTTILSVFRKNVSIERQIPIVGKHNKHLFSMQKFTGQDLSIVDSVQVDIGNALEQTAPGRFQLATLFKDMGFLQTPEQVTQVLETGKFEPATQSLRDRLTLIAEEAEALRGGQVPPVHTYQDHLLHYRENAAVLESAEALKDERVVRAVQEHCDWHYREFWGLPDHEIDPMTGQPVLDPLTGQPKKMAVQSDPQFLVRIRIMLGQQPPPMMGPPVDGLPPGGGPDVPAGGPPADGDIPALAPPAGAAMNGGGVAQPPNPVAGGAPFDPTGGGLVA